MPDEQAEVAVTVLVDPERFDAAVAALSEAGFKVDQRQREIGTVSGRVRSADLAAMSTVDGVMAVEPERGIQLPPPDSDLQ